MSGIDPTLLLAALIVASTPILLAAIGELVVERSGVLNLGVEGMMIVGAICGFAVAVETGSPVLGFLGAAVGGALLSMIFGVLTQFLLSNQVATGLALTLFGLGLSALIGQGYIGVRPPPTRDLDLGFLSDLPFFGRVVFTHDWVVYLSLALVAGVWWGLNRTRAGLILQAGNVIGFGQASDMAEYKPSPRVSSIIDNWGPHYINRVQALIDGTWASQSVWEGISDKTVMIGEMTEAIPEEVRAEAQALADSIASGAYHPFTGPLKKQDGSAWLAEGETPEDGVLLSMDFYVEGLTSEIPN